MSFSDSSYSPGDNLVSILWGCELSSAQSSFTFQVPEDSSYDQQLVLCSICLDAAARDEFHVVEIIQDSGSRSPVTVATLKPSVQPTVALYGMELNPPVTFHLRAGSGPVCISGQHISQVQSSDEDEDDDEEEEEEEEMEEPPKRSGAQNGGAAKKWKLEQGNAGVGDPPRQRPRAPNSRIPSSLRSRSSRSPKAPLASRGRGAGRGRKAATKQ